MKHHRTGDFRAFLYRHAELLRALQEWTVRLLMPMHLATERKTYEYAFREEYASPLRPLEVEEIRWFFRQQDPSLDTATAPFQSAQRTFAAPRFRALHQSLARAR
jgi:hypothetical protein